MKSLMKSLLASKRRVMAGSVGVVPPRPAPVQFNVTDPGKLLTSTAENFKVRVY